MFKPVGFALKKGVSVVHAGKTIYRIVDEWVKAYKSLPDSVKELKATVTTIIAVTEQHIRLQNTSVEPVLEAIYNELNDARDLLISYQKAKKATVFVKAKKFDRNLNKRNDSLKGHLEFLSTALRVAAPTEFNPVNVLKGVDDAALRFWVESFGSVNSVPATVFRDAVLNYAQTRFPKGCAKIASNLVIRKEHSNATFTIYMFKDLLLLHEGFDMTIKSFAYSNPFVEHSFVTTQTCVCNCDNSHPSMSMSPSSSVPSSVSSSSVSSVSSSSVAAGMTPQVVEEAKILFDPNLKNHFYIVSQVGKDPKTGAAMCLQPGDPSSDAAGEDGALKVVIAVCRGTERQQWSFGSDGYIVNRETGMVLDVECVDDRKFVQGAEVRVSPAANRNSQNWTFNEKGVVLPAMCRGMCLDVDRGVNQEGSRVVLWKMDTSDAVPPNNQRWKVCRNPPLVLDRSRIEEAEMFGEETEKDGGGDDEEGFTPTPTPY